tara:strand:- start:640 stop:1077 length:438 start_codon:yes stop_codon:yes gene_type:complete
MDLYDISFFLSTMWVGPFWLAMLVYPDDEKTKQILKGPWFFLGPILIWWAVTLSAPEGLIDLAEGFSDPLNILDSLVGILGTPAGASAAWAHMVAGDIFITRWMWKRCLERGTERWISGVSVFFGVMLMPVGLALHLALVREESG